MVSQVTAAQRKVLERAEPVTGRITGGAAVLERLVKLGLAFRHPRPPHAFFLTPAGHRLREAEPPDAAERAGRSGGETARPGVGPPGSGRGGASADAADGTGAATPAEVRGADRAAAGSAPSGEDSGGVFAARTGYEQWAGPGTPGRAREVRSAWLGLLEMRRMTNPDGDTGRPCAWERTHLVRSAALALEAAGLPPGPGPGGYRVSATAQPEAVAVRGGLTGCAEALTRAGWQVGEHRDRRTDESYLLASPRRV
ncbi:hypothetical protein [Streptomyces tsukubensis]|uniref:Uncharacterized protein n=1 Tax=Streptomyces tsukubensis TaxID=83656 RepID=A0A1V4AD08_9ACTN|nr:hypothetical protein [Streptomyces tsukubensis]OON81640.1 hypothetical protein B1H18_05650 [Streptomyces tsukubensis]QFR96415.1 hypothetical protein GBW32_29490 [Streptomyces tsukubensis]